MIVIKNKEAVRKMRIAGQKLAEIFQALSSRVVPDVTTLALDEFIESELRRLDLVSACKGYRGYRHVSCISVNDTVVHGVPNAETICSPGDLVKIDICASYKGYCADAARCYFVGRPMNPAAEDFVAVAQRSLDKAIEKAVPGNRLTDISAMVQTVVEHHGYGVVRDFAGHGIGKQMHEEPEVLNFGKPGSGPKLRAGMTLAIEPMITMGRYPVYVCEDGWTVKTKDSSLAAHVEDTVLISENGPEILTRAMAH